MIEIMDISMVLVRYNIQDSAAPVPDAVWKHNEKQFELCKGSVNTAKKQKAGMKRVTQGHTKQQESEEMRFTQWESQLAAASIDFPSRLGFRN